MLLLYSFLLTHWNRQDTECVTLTSCLSTTDSKVLSGEKLLQSWRIIRITHFEGYVVVVFFNTLHIRKSIRPPVHRIVHSIYIYIIFLFNWTKIVYTLFVVYNLWLRQKTIMHWPKITGCINLACYVWVCKSWELDLLKWLNHGCVCYINCPVLVL